MMRSTNSASQILCLIGVMHFMMPMVLPILMAVARIVGFAAFADGGVARVGRGSTPK
jgi:hypothetical protein